jgi:type I restriction-modification system DNA methylase subunit
MTTAEQIKVLCVRVGQFFIIGDDYEYLMTMYASNAGKSGGEFFTHADVSELLTRPGTDETEGRNLADLLLSENPFSLFMKGIW